MTQEVNKEDSAAAMSSCALRFEYAWLDQDTWASIPKYMHAHIARRAAIHAEQARLAGYQQGVADERERAARVVENFCIAAKSSPTKQVRTLFASAIRNTNTTGYREGEA